LVDAEAKCTGSFYRKKAIEKTILHVLRSSAFSQPGPEADIDRFTAALSPNTDGNRIAPLLPWQGSGLPWTKRKYGWVLI
jgi:hypothetical protein